MVRSDSVKFIVPEPTDFSPILKISLGEMMAYLPIAGGHITMADRFVSKGFGFLLGWNYWYNWVVVLPAELRCVICSPPSLTVFNSLNRSAAAVLVGYWNDTISPAVWITVCMVVIIMINMLGAGPYMFCVRWDLAPCSPEVGRCIRRSRVRICVREHPESTPSIDSPPLNRQFHQGLDHRWPHYPRSHS